MIAADSPRGRAVAWYVEGRPLAPMEHLFEDGGVLNEDRSPHLDRWQHVLNDIWPPIPATFHEHKPGIAVSVRILWSRDGEEFLTGVATRWNDANVFVEFTDPRLRLHGVWVRPEDVERR